MMNPFKAPKVVDAKKAGESKWGMAILLMAGVTMGSLGAFLLLSTKTSKQLDECEKKYEKFVQQVFIAKGTIDNPSVINADSSAFWKARADSVKNLLNQVMENKEIIRK